MDIKPTRPRSNPNPGRNQTVKPAKPSAPAPDDATTLEVPEELLKSGKKVPLLNANNRNSHKKRWILIILGALLGLIILAAVGALLWYNDALGPKSKDDQRIRVTIESGATPEQISDTLEDKGVIKSSLAFQILLKQTGKRDSLKAGNYLLSPKLSANDVLAYLADGRVDTFNVTILPGQTLAEIKAKLIKDGFAAADINAAFVKKYDHPLLSSKPAGVSLEGYIYPETYQINSETTVEQLLTRSFDQFYSQIQAKGLEKALADRGFALHQGVTLASIIQMEAAHSSDRRQIAQVFEKRLKDDIMLGSDVTFMYAAELTGQTASPDLDSPYNTRRYKGLPPGAIANFTLDSLQAVANPAEGDYLYFVAGDDGKVYYARTDAEHQQNIKQYCTKLCNQ